MNTIRGSWCNPTAYHFLNKRRLGGRERGRAGRREGELNHGIEEGRGGGQKHSDYAINTSAVSCHQQALQSTASVYRDEYTQTDSVTQTTTTQYLIWSVVGRREGN